MNKLNLKQMTIAAMLGTSLLLTGCGGGGGAPVAAAVPDPVDTLSEWSDWSSAVLSGGTQQTRTGQDGDFDVEFEFTSALKSTITRTRTVIVNGERDANPPGSLIETDVTITTHASAETEIDRNRRAGTLDEAEWGEWTSTGTTTGGVTTNHAPVPEGDFDVVYSDTTAVTGDQTRSQHVRVNGVADATPPSLASDQSRSGAEISPALTGTEVSRVRRANTLDTQASDFTFESLVSSTEDNTGSEDLGIEENVVTGTAASTEELVTETFDLRLTTTFADTAIVEKFIKVITINGENDGLLSEISENRTRYEPKASTERVDTSGSRQVANPVYDATAGTYLESVDLTQGTADTKTSYISEAVTEFSGDIDDALDIAALELSTLTGETITADDIRAITEAQLIAKLADAVNAGVLAAEDAFLIRYEWKAFKELDSINSASDIYGRLNVSGVEDAHNAGWTGLGSKIAIFDEEFYPDTGDKALTGHGFNVGLLAGAVAPGADFVIHDRSGAFAFTTDTSVDVANHSYGIHLTDYFTANELIHASAAEITTEGASWMNTYNNNLSNTPEAVVVYSAGNNGAVDSFGTTLSTWENGILTRGGRLRADAVTDIRFVYNEGADVSRTIFVGSIGSATADGLDNDTLADYSVSAGPATMNDFIVADGSSFTGSDGTSFAAPRVAGAVALVAHKFPNTEAEDRKLIILNTADDLGATGVDAVFGHGLLNVGAALSPVGNLR